MRDKVSADVLLECGFRRGPAERYELPLLADGEESEFRLACFETNGRYWRLVVEFTSEPLAPGLGLMAVETRQDILDAMRVFGLEAAPLIPAAK